MSLRIIMSTLHLFVFNIYRQWWHVFGSRLPHPSSQFSTKRRGSTIRNDPSPVGERLDGSRFLVPGSRPIGYRLSAIYLLALFMVIACGNLPAGSTPNNAPTVTIGTLQISDVWARSAQVLGGENPPTPIGMDNTKPTEAAMSTAMIVSVGAAYMTIKNTGSAPDKLIKAQGDVSAAVELHTMIETNGVMQMRPVENIEIPANGEVQLKPGGLHVMLIGLKKDLKAGDSIPLTLQFEKSGTIQVLATVRDTK